MESSCRHKLEGAKTSEATDTLIDKACKAACSFDFDMIRLNNKQLPSLFANFNLEKSVQSVWKGN